MQFNLFRYELPGINGLNFVLLNSLGGGGVASLRVDPQVDSQTDLSLTNCMCYTQLHLLTKLK